jgi:hypothetical protein
MTRQLCDTIRIKQPLQTRCQVLIKDYCQTNGIKSQTDDQLIGNNSMDQEAEALSLAESEISLR